MCRASRECWLLGRGKLADRVAERFREIPGFGQDAERGLIFNAHCADLFEQFEFIQQIWANNVDFQQQGDGPDPVIGTDGQATLREAGSTVQLDFKRFVHTTGALYAFAPSKRTLQRLAHGDL